MSPIFDLDVRHCRELKVELLFLCVKRSQLRCFGHGCKTLEVFWAYSTGKRARMLNKERLSGVTLLGEVSNTVYLFIMVPVGEWYIREQVNFVSSKLMC